MLLLIRKIIISIFFILIVIPLAAQTKQANNWFFGYNIGVNFNTTPPSIITNSPINQLEGTAAISDESGQMLFYTDGVTVWDKLHTPMPNGSGLLGGFSSSQSALIIPKPGSTSIFFIFTTAEWSNLNSTGLRYSTVDMSLNNGQGDIVAGDKNIALLSSSTEKLAAIYHSNGKDIWVVTSKYNTNQFYAYLITDEGICDCPVISLAGQLQTEFQGCLKFSPAGTKLVSAEATNGAQLFDFDACSGRLTYFDKLPVNTETDGHYYGASFSPDNTKLYITTWSVGGLSSKLWQYDMQASSIAMSKTLVVDGRNIADPNYCRNGSSGFGAMQIGPDLKLYVANYLYCYFHVITAPNEAAPNVGFVKEGLYVGWGYLGLPNFIESYFNTSVTPKTCSPTVVSTTPDFSYSNACLLQSTQFTNLSKATPESSMCYYWDFGDSASGYANISDQSSPSHTFSAPGTYQVTLKVTTGSECKSSTISKTISIFSLPQSNLGKDQIVCDGDSVLLETKLIPGATYLWQDKSSKSSFTVKKPGIYWVEVSQGGCSFRDSVSVDMFNRPIINLGKDTILCQGTSYTLNASRLNQAVNYLWQDGTTSPTFLVQKAGTYWVEISNSICTARDTINITYDTPYEIDLGEDLILCLGDQHKVSLDSYPNIEYEWSSKGSGHDLIIDEAGTYWVKYKNLGTTCLRTDTIKITFQECLDDLKIPNVFTPNGDNKNDSFLITGAKGTLWNLVVFNRWGVQVAKYENYRNDWEAHGLENAIYYYVLTNQYSGKSFKGWVQVLR